MKLEEGQMVMLTDGPARVESVTEHAATVRYVVGVEGSPVRRETISSDNADLIVCETPTETRARRQEYSLVAWRQAAPLRGCNDGLRDMFQLDLLDNTRASLFAQRAQRGRKAAPVERESSFDQCEKRARERAERTSGDYAGYNG
jgi:hypothetical protein